MTRLWLCFAILILLVGSLSGQATLTVLTTNLPQGTVGVLYQAWRRMAAFSLIPGLSPTDLFPLAWS